MIQHRFINSGIIHYEADTTYELCSAFIRIQEFYESPYEDFRGKFFLLDDYMDRYAADNGGKFTYFEDWNGFNIPGNAIIEFYRTYHGYIQNEYLREKERKLLEPLLPMIHGRHEGFYIIGSVKGSKITLDHELRHAAYYMNHEYKAECFDLVQAMPDELRSQVYKVLANYGYDVAVFPDETQAYFGTETPADLAKRFSVSKADAKKWAKKFSEVPHGY